MKDVPSVRGLRKLRLVLMKLVVVGSPRSPNEWLLTNWEGGGSQLTICHGMLYNELWLFLVSWYE